LRKLKTIIMKKQLLLAAFLVGSFFSAVAQDTCATATPITAGGTYTVAAVDGTYSESCIAGDADFAEWYRIVPTENALITVTTNLAANVGGDTRLSVFTGSCTSLSCVDANDDVSANIFLSEVTFQALAGETYYISFDDYWEADGFNFQVTFTPTSCFAPTGFSYVNNAPPTLTSVAIEWDVPATTPVNYQFEYGVGGFTQGTGTSLTLTVPQVTLENLTSGTDYDFYVRTNCGNGDYSEWTGPVGFTTAFTNANLNYAYGFETANLNGWTSARAIPAGGTAPAGAGWARYTSATAFPGQIPAQEGTGVVAAGANTGVSNAYLFSRAINVAAGQVVNISYYVRKIVGAGAGGTNNVGLSYGTAATIAGQTTVLSAPAIVTSTTAWTQRTATFTATTAGVYYIAFRYTSAAQIATNYGWAAIDNVTITSPTAGTNNADLAEFSVFPNPANNIVNITNAKVAINNVSVTDLNGRTVKNAKFDGVAEAQVNISDLASGIYMMTISSDKGTTTKKIVKN
jgi:hypothetical protein